MKVFLRAFNVSDFEAIYPWLLEKKNQSHTTGYTYFASKDYVKKWVEDKIFNTKDIYLAICLIEIQEMIGYLSIKEIDHRYRKAMIGGILIGNKAYCRGTTALEAGYLAMKYVFEELNINLLWTYALEEQLATIRLCEKLGFKKTGYLPQSVFKGGKYHNEIFLCVLSEEFNQLKVPE